MRWPADNLDSILRITDVCKANRRTRHFIQFTKPQLQLIHTRRQSSVKVRIDGWVTTANADMINRTSPDCSWQRDA